MDRFVCSRLLEWINLEIQTALQVSRTIRPFQNILGERVKDLHTSKPEEYGIRRREIRDSLSMSTIIPIRILSRVSAPILIIRHLKISSLVSCEATPEIKM